MKKIKKAIVMMAMTGAVAVSGMLGGAMTANAANVEDTKYTYSGSGTEATKWRAKQDYSKVYVYPTSGKTAVYTVQGKKGETAIYRSNSHSIPVGTQASITNYVRENGNYYARVEMKLGYTNTGAASGVWSPDSTKNYTVYK